MRRLLTMAPSLTFIKQHDLGACWEVFELTLMLCCVDTTFSSSVRRPWCGCIASSAKVRLSPTHRFSSQESVSNGAHLPWCYSSENSKILKKHKKTKKIDARYNLAVLARTACTCPFDLSDRFLDEILPFNRIIRFFVDEVVANAFNGGNVRPLPSQSVSSGSHIDPSQDRREMKLKVIELRSQITAARAS
jgi:hypothetical protein